MFAEFLNIIFKSIKLDKSLYSDNKNFGEASIYFAGIIMILDGIAGAVAANTIEVNLLENEDNFTDDEWSNLYKLSEETFVEESDSLKEGAAGAGLTDND